jgi:signal peptidase I
MTIFLQQTWKENRGFIIFIMLMFVFRSAIADWNHVPTGSMKPTILEGDQVLVNKMAYDIRFPFSHYSLVKLADPKRGDIIVFDSKVSNKRPIKRVVGVPGDTIAMKNNVLYINGERLSYFDSSSIVSDRIEDLLGVQHLVRTRMKGGQLSNFWPVIVPDDQYMALGDNRDNSADSRVIGFIPRDEIVGRSRKAVLSLNYDNYFLPRTTRFFHTL